MPRTDHNEVQEKMSRVIRKWLHQTYGLDHHTVGYVGMFGVWDIMGNNKLDSNVIISGRTEHLLELKENLCTIIDEEIARREAEVSTSST
jgi:hypothetical protein